MVIEEFMKTDNVRLSMGNKWMYYSDSGEWVVLKHEYGKKHNDTLYAGQNLNEALMDLRNG